MHLERLALSCERLNIVIDLAKVQRDIDLCLQSIDPSVIHGRLKIIASRGGRGVGCYPAQVNSDQVNSSKSSPANENSKEPDDSANISVIFSSSSTPNFAESAPVELKLAGIPLYDMPILAGLKHLNRLNYIVAAVDVTVAAPREELLFLDVRDNLVETMHCNVFLLADDATLYTPKLSVAGVHGVMRKLVMEDLAPQCGFRVVETEIPFASLGEFTEIFICNAMKGVIPVKSIATNSKLARQQNVLHLCESYQCSMLLQKKLKQNLQKYLVE